MRPGTTNDTVEFRLGATSTAGSLQITTKTNGSNEVEIRASDPAAGSGTDLRLTAGNGVGGASGGGQLSITGGVGAEANGGQLNFRGGSTSVTGPPSGTPTGAALFLAGGSTSLGGRPNEGGAVTLVGGSGVVTGFDGGSVTFSGGPAISGGAGGLLTLRGGSAVTGAGGSVVMDTGAAPGGTEGTISIGTTNATSVSIGRSGQSIGFYGVAAVGQSAAYTRNAAVVEDRTLLASASATNVNNNNVLAALIADLQAVGIFG